jgi:hypothetical protein
MIAILDGGRIVAEGSPDELKRRRPGGHIRLQFADTQSMGSAAQLLDTDPGDPETLTLQVPGDSSVSLPQRGQTAPDPVRHQEVRPRTERRGTAHVIGDLP